MSKCGLCGEPMPPGEEMFMYHGFSGPCPKPMLTPTETKGGCEGRNAVQMREMLLAMQAGELTVSRGVEILEIWLAGNYADDQLPPVADLGLGEDETPAARIIQLEARVKELEAERDKLDVEATHLIRQRDIANDELTASRQQVERLVEALIHIQQVACSESPELGIATEALAAVEKERIAGEASSAEGATSTDQGNGRAASRPSR